jgi:hypothetical protein
VFRGKAAPGTLLAGIQDPELGKAVGEGFVLERFQDGIIRLGSKPDEIALNVGAHDASVRNRPRCPDALLADHSTIDFAQPDGVGRAPEADAAVAAIRRRLR